PLRDVRVLAGLSFRRGDRRGLAHVVRLRPRPRAARAHRAALAPATTASGEPPATGDARRVSRIHAPLPDGTALPAARGKAPAIAVRRPHGLCRGGGPRAARSAPVVPRPATRSQGQPAVAGRPRAGPGDVPLRPPARPAAALAGPSPARDHRVRAPAQ